MLTHEICIYIFFYLNNENFNSDDSYKYGAIISDYLCIIDLWIFLTIFLPIFMLKQV